MTDTTSEELVLQQLSECLARADPWHATAPTSEQLHRWNNRDLLVYVTDPHAHSLGDSFVNVWASDPMDPLHSMVTPSPEDTRLFQAWSASSASPVRINDWRLSALSRFCELYGELRQVKHALAVNQTHRLARLKAIALLVAGPAEPTDSALAQLEQDEVTLMQRLRVVVSTEQHIRARCDAVVGSALVCSEIGELARIKFMHRQRHHLRCRHLDTPHTNMSTIRRSTVLSWLFGSGKPVATEDSVRRWIGRGPRAWETATHTGCIRFNPELEWTVGHVDAHLLLDWETLHRKYTAFADDHPALCTGADTSSAPGFRVPLKKWRLELRLRIWQQLARMRWQSVVQSIPLYKAQLAQNQELRFAAARQPRTPHNGEDGNDNDNAGRQELQELRKMEAKLAVQLTLTKALDELYRTHCLRGFRTVGVVGTGQIAREQFRVQRNMC